MDKREPYSVAYWAAEIRAYDQCFKPWCDRTQKIIDLYRDTEITRPTERGKFRYNLFWSNVQTTRPALYARTPKPVVEERLKDGNQLVRFAAHIWEKAIEYNLKNQRFDDAMADAVKDLLMGGRGTLWTYYDPRFGTEMVGQDENGTDIPELLGAEAKVDFVLWKDFGHTVDRRWAEVRAVWRKVYLTEAQFKVRFGESKKVVYDQLPDYMIKENAKDAERKACIYEVWCKETKRAYWLNLDLPEFLDEKDDPLRLAEFFPCPRPLFGTDTTDSLVPLPDYAMVQDMYQQLDALSGRIGRLESAVRVCGARDAGSEELDRLLTEDLEGLIPVKDWPTYMQAGGLRGVIDFLPLADIVGALNVLYEARDRLKAALDELTGTSDLVRGSTNAQETATAQQLKNSYQNLRIGDRQREVQRFARDTIDIQAEIIAEHFPPELIASMSGVDLSAPEMQQMFMQAVELLRNDRRRRFFVNIETDSTINIDEQAEKQAVSELLQALGTFLQQFLQFGQMAPEFMPALGQFLVFAMRRYRAGRPVEDAVEQAVGQFLQAQQQRLAQQQQDPNAAQLEQNQQQMAQNQQQMQMQMQLEQMKMQMQQAEAERKAQADVARMQAELQRTQAELEIKSAELVANAEKGKEELALKRAELISKLELEREKISAEHASRTLDREARAREVERSAAERAMAKPERALESPTKRRIVMDNGRTAEIQDVFE